MENQNRLQVKYAHNNINEILTIHNNIIRSTNTHYVTCLINNTNNNNNNNKDLYYRGINVSYT